MSIQTQTQQISLTTAGSTISIPQVDFRDILFILVCIAILYIIAGIWQRHQDGKSPWER